MQVRNRYIAAAWIFAENPVVSLRYVLDSMLGRVEKHRLRFGDISLVIRTNTPDLKVVRSILLGEFDAAIAATRPDADFIVDAGGYIGLVSILLAKRFPMARVVCLEPSTENFALARENCAPYSNISVLKVALSAHRGRTMLLDRGTGQWGFTTVAGTYACKGVIEQVEQVTLQELMSQFSVKRINFLKLDIEGAEYELLKDPDTWLQQCDVLMVELHERFCPGVESLYSKACQGRQEIHSVAEKRLSVSAGI